MLDADVIQETPQHAARRLASGMIARGYRLDALHLYTDLQGQPIYWRIRLKHANGSKWIRPMRALPDGSFELTEPPAPVSGKWLYRLHDLAHNPEARVIVCEGEKAADALARLGLIVTTSSGATSAAAADWTPLQGRIVLIWPDHDPPGAQYGREVADKLLALGCSVRIVDAAALGLPPKGDAVEWLAAHPDATAADVVALPIVAQTATPATDEPVPLPGELAPVDAFDYTLLPDALRPWVADIAERVSCPPDFVALPAMLALGCALGRKIAVRPQQHSDWTVTPNLWGLVIGRPGAMKSPAMAQATAPLKRLAARAQDQYDTAQRDWMQSQKLRDLQGEAAEKKARAMLAKDPGANVTHLLDGGTPDPEPTLRRYTTTNATPEALGELLRQNPQGLMLERDEIMGLLRDLDREDKADHRAFLLEAWDGSGAYTFDRIGRGFNLHIQAMCLSVVGTTQPGRIRDYLSDALRGGAGDDGLIQRFSMMVWPDQTGEWRNVDQWPDGAAKKSARAVFDRLDTLDAHAIGAMQDTDLDGKPEGVPYLRLSAGALTHFVAWRTELESRLRSGDLHPALESHLSKYRKLVPALALICHLADNGTGPVTEAAMLRALAWAVYLESHAWRIYGGAVAPEVDAARAILRRIKRGDLPRDGFSSRDVWRPGWSGLSDHDLVTAALAYLVDMEWLHAERVQTTGRPSTVYRLNGSAKL